MTNSKRRLAMEGATTGPIACRSCDLNEVCRLCGLIALETGATRQSTGALRSVEPGASLFRAGTPANSIYAVRQGMVKTVRVTAEGDEAVLDIHTPGEVLGLEGFGAGTYSCDAIALGRVVCCELPLPMLGEQSIRVRQLSAALLRLLSLAAKPRVPAARGPVRQRVTTFLLDLAQRLTQRGLDGHQFSLGLSRQELANLLDARLETISRQIQRLHRERVIHIKGNLVTLLALGSKPSADLT
ncbi:MAG TPA: Crp/Fnr family transcriptional regulator [Steroidobacter sp.]|uniref:Crp/Fnr family transcriptional regulator n=1 Tax=Steroidobacter sp. TaxID=1978227 RepID=UPI002ED85145